MTARSPRLGRSSTCRQAHEARRTAAPPGDQAEPTETAGRTVLILGNLNVGKTTLFNRLCGRHSRVANFPGTSISVGRGVTTEADVEFRFIDTPGIDSMLPESEDERISRGILLQEDVDIIAHVADGKNLRKSLLLLLQLAEFGKPLILDINMMDEARQRGVDIDMEGLAALTGVPVTATVATEGEGVGSFRRALPDARLPRLTASLPEKLESAIALVSRLLVGSGLPPRAVATALLAGDEELKGVVSERCGEDVAGQVEAVAFTAQSVFSRPLGGVIQEARQKAVDRVLAEVQTVSPPARTPMAVRLGEWCRRPLTGIPIAVIVVALMYLFVGNFGAQMLVGFLEGQVFGEWVVPALEKLSAWIPSEVVKDALFGEFGLISVAVVLAFGVVVPVLATFFFAFGILEESGYLPRLSVLLDRSLRTIGLNGKGLLPLVLGFSCITMAILTTRTLDTKRERFIATLLLVLGLPCAPLLAVMLVLFAGMTLWAPVVVFGVIFLQIVIVGHLLSRILPGMRSDFILELPPMRIPRIAPLLRRTASRVWWFTKEAVPYFLVATFVMFLLDLAGGLTLLEMAAKPVVTGLLGLPTESVQVVIMTLIRREAGAALLLQLSDAGLFTNLQIVVSLLMLTFLTPCVNAVIIMVKELGVKGALAIMGFVLPYAILVGTLLNWVCRLLDIDFS